MRLLCKWTFTVVFFANLAMGATAQAITYYVDRNLPGSDSNNGTSESTPFFTIQRCFNALGGPGDTCLVKNGIYAEALYLKPIQGTSSLPVTIKNYPGHRPVIDGTGLNNNGVALNSDATTASQVLSYVIFSGFEVRNARYECVKYKNANHLTIEHNYLHDCGHGSGTHGNGIYGQGIYITIQSNYALRNGYPEASYGHGFYVQGSHYRIINNISANNYGLGLQTRADAVQSYMPSSEYAIVSDFLIANNTFAYNQYGSAMNLWFNTSSTITNITIANNIFYENNHSGGSANGIRIYCCPSNVTVQNNIAYGTSGATNFIYNDGCTNCTFANSNCPSTNHTTTSCATNPNMMNAPASFPGSPDFQLTSGSVAKDAGFNLTASGVTQDFSANVRPVDNGYDIGAYEFGSNLAKLAPPMNLKVQ